MAKTDVAVSKGRLERMPRPLTPFGDIDRAFEEFFGRHFPRALGWGDPLQLAPDIDVIDREEEVVVRAVVPGYKKDDIEISVSGNTLTLKGETATDGTEETGEYYRKEISRAAFSRTIALPAEVDDSKAKASMKDGMLELTLPKVEKSKRRTIAIS